MSNPVLVEGKRAPAFNLPSNNGGDVRLTEQRGKWVVLYFYPKDMTRGCTIEACDFRDRHRAFKRNGAVVYGVSPDSLDRHERFAEKHDLPFALLVDRDSKIASKYGVLREKSNQGSQYLGIVRSTFLIDPSGKIARVFDNVRVNGHAEKVLEALREERAE